MGIAIQELTVEGFKSIRKLEKFELRNLNVLIGANGAGKSNFVELFRLLRAMADGNLQNYVAKAGGGDGLFFGGPKTTPKMNVQLVFGEYQFSFSLEPTADNGVVLSNESIFSTGVPSEQFGSKGHRESILAGLMDSLVQIDVSSKARQAITKLTVYHFHDTGHLSSMRREQSIDDTAYLRSDASNLAAFLLSMKIHRRSDYSLVRDTTRLVAPFFGDFLLSRRANGRAVSLDWHQKGSDFPFQAWHLSDGTLRFICLATALLQPDPPPTIVIDEPELGLHPHALEVLAGLLQKAAQRGQVIVSTQSAPLLSQFEPEDVITVTRKDGASNFRRLDRADLAEWMNDYTLGELWQKNVVEAGASDD